MIRSLVSICFGLFLVSCTSDKAPMTPPPANTSSVSATPATTGGDPAKPAGGKDSGEIKPAVAKDIETAKAIAASAVAGVQEILDKVTDPSFSVDSLKAAIVSLKPEDLKALADKLVGALTDSQGIVKGVQDQIANLGLADVTMLGDLKKKLESATTQVAQLKEKLTVVVAKLKEHGIDVSKYAALLGGK